jgi:acrylyl-CoA reductase (NADPH)
MERSVFNAILIEKNEQGQHAYKTQIADERLPAGDVTVRIEASTLNYKDALAITGKGPIVRRFPMIPGIDFAGIVESSDHPEIKAGDRVLLNGWGVGEQHWGGLSEKARVRSDWLIKTPDEISSRDAMAIGTAGYTAMLCVMAIERFGLSPTAGDVLVTGASGGVGSIAIALLKQLGYRVVAATGRPAEEAYLRALGASEILDRKQLEEPGKPLQKERWAAAIDTVGSRILANVCASIKADGAVAACGMAQGLDFPASVAPFILRGVNLLGVNSVTRPRSERIEAWRRLAQSIDALRLDQVTREIELADAVDAANDLLDGKVRGRIAVNVQR